MDRFELLEHAGNSAAAAAAPAAVEMNRRRVIRSMVRNLRAI
jgi:hypothetical protein